MSDDKITRLAAEATRLKKAWVMGVALAGKPPDLPPDHLEIPNYLHYQIKHLKRHIEDLQSDMDEVGKSFILEDWKPSRRNNVIPWLAEKHDAWIKSNQLIWELGRVYEVEQAIGRLKVRKHIECPVYAQVLIQGFNGTAIRHPEYHLARDLALLNNLFLDAEAMVEAHKRSQKRHCNEISQSLGRSTILTCYNLLESFVSGLVAAFIIENPNAPEETIRKLEKPKDRSLKARFEEVPALVSGVPNVMEPFRSVLTPLFGDYQKRRNAFVHCEPGPITPKEAFFHETNAKIVRETVSLTISAIRAAWKVVQKTEGPRWLPDPDPKGRFLNIAVNLTETPPPS
jgi:hypothetical protein